jgi:hypothetical protein
MEEIAAEIHQILLGHRLNLDGNAGLFAHLGNGTCDALKSFAFLTRPSNGDKGSWNSK